MELDRLQTEAYLRHISDILLINGGRLDNPGLHTGEMGLVLFFARYARFTQNELYSDYSFEMIKRVQSRVNQETTVNYGQGLSGIGSTIEFLVQNGYFEADTDRVLKDFDERIFFTYNLSYLAFAQVIDIGYYALWRMSGRSTLKDKIFKTVLLPIAKIMEEWSRSDPINYPSASFFREIISSENCISHSNHSLNERRLQLCRMNSPDFLDMEAYDRLTERFSKKGFFENKFLRLGVKNGIAGWGLHSLSKLDDDDSWIALFPV